MFKVVMKILIMYFVLFQNVVLGKNVYVNNNQIYIEGILFPLFLIKDELGTMVVIKNGNIEITNQFNGSSIVKSAVKYVFDKDRLSLKNIIKINHDTNFDKYYGYNINISDDVTMLNINSDYVDQLESAYEPENYEFATKDKCPFINLWLKFKEVSFNYCNVSKKSIFIVNYDKYKNLPLHIKGFSYCLLNNELLDVVSKSCKNVAFVKEKSFLYFNPNIYDKSNMYLIKGDQVSIIDEVINDFNEKWYRITYEGKKKINMWIKSENVKLN